MEKLKQSGTTTELRDLCNEAEYYSLSSLHKHLSTLISESKAPAPAKSYPRCVVVTTQSGGFVSAEALRLLKDAGFEFKSSVQPDGSVHGIETLYFTTSKTLSAPTLSRLREQLDTNSRRFVRTTPAPVGTRVCASCSVFADACDGCRFSFI